MNRAVLMLFGAPVLFGQQEQPPFQSPSGVRPERNLVYSSPGGRDLHLDLYLPTRGRGPWPAVVYIHGGAWKGGNKNAFRRQAAHMATRGFAGA